MDELELQDKKLQAMFRRSQKSSFYKRHSRALYSPYLHHLSQQFEAYQNAYSNLEPHE